MAFGLTVPFVMLIAAVLFVFFIVRFSRASRIHGRVFDIIEERLDQAAREQQAGGTSGPRKDRCDKCGATFAEPPDVSPSGDFQCAYCGQWNSIHA